MRQAFASALFLLLAIALLPLAATADEPVAPVEAEQAIDETLDSEVAELFVELEEPELASTSGGGDLSCCSFQEIIACGNYCANEVGGQCSENTHCSEGQCICECICI